MIALSRMSIVHNKSSTLPSRAKVYVKKSSFKRAEKAAEKRVHKKRQKQDLLNKGSLFDRLSCSCLPYLQVLVPLSYTFQDILSIENWKFQALKSKNRSLEGQYVFNMLVMEFIIVWLSSTSLLIKLKCINSNQEAGPLVKFLKVN